MEATSDPYIQLSVLLTPKDITALEKNKLLEGKLKIINQGKVTSEHPLKIHYAKTSRELVAISLTYKDEMEAGRTYNFFAIYLCETNLKRIKAREISYFGMIWEPKFIRQGWISLEDVI